MRCIVAVITLLIASSCGGSREDILRDRINDLISQRNLVAGITIFDLEENRVIYSINGDRQFPMQSVYKLPIALTMLREIDRGVFFLTDSVVIDQSILLPDMWSPLREQYPMGVTLTIAELLEYTLTKSDNNASDIIMKMVGGVDSVDRYIGGLIEDTAIRNYEYELQRDSRLQYDNYSTPNSMIKLLNMINDSLLLEDGTHRFLLDVMRSSRTGSLRDSLPSDIVIANKSGYSGVDPSGMVAANNDVAIISLPEGRQLLIAIFISESYEEPEANYTIISRTAQILFNF